MRPILVVRDEQMRALSLPLLEAWLESHVREYFPERSGALSPCELRAMVRDGIAKAHAYGFKTDSDVCRFVDISVVLGAGFDTELPWASSILSDPSFEDAAVRLEMLFESACGHLRGPHEESE